MKITINGKEKIFSDNTTICDMLAQMNFESKKTLVLLNDQIIENEAWQKHTLKEGDSIEIISFVEGG